MNEIDKAAYGYQYDPELRLREVANGTASTGTVDMAPAFDMDGSDLYLTVSSANRLDSARTELAELSALEYLSDDLQLDKELLEVEVDFLEAVATMQQLEAEHPKDTRLVADFLIDLLDQMTIQGQPVDAQMYEEAELLAQTIIEQNPGKDAGELLLILAAMRRLIYTEERLETFEETHPELLAA